METQAAAIEYDHGIVAVDSGFLRPWLAAVYLIVENGRVAVVDTGSNDSVPRVLAALEERGLAPECVDFVILTHVHLDHAGGAGLLMSRLPNATLCVHPRGVRHMVDPSRLVQGTIEVYGVEHARKVYGEVVPVPEQRTLAAGEGARISLAGRELVVLETPGHARHHCCIRDGKSKAIFAGDTFGLAYRELEAAGWRFVFPTTSPVQFDPQALHASIDRIVALRPPRVFVTHFGGLDEVDRLAADLHRLIDAHVAIARANRDAGARRQAAIEEGLRELVVEEARRQGWGVSPQEALEIFGLDLELNAQGLDVWLGSAAAR